MSSLDGSESSSLETTDVSSSSVHTIAASMESKLPGKIILDTKPIIVIHAYYYYSLSDSPARQVRRRRRRQRRLLQEFSKAATASGCNAILGLSFQESELASPRGRGRTTATKKGK